MSRLLVLSVFSSLVIFSGLMFSCQETSQPSFSLSGVSFDTKNVTPDNFGRVTGDVALQPSITLNFSTSIDAGTLNGNIKMIDIQTGTPVAIQFKAVSQNDKAAVVQLSSTTTTLKRGGQYKLVVPTSVKSSAGGSLDKEYTLAFNTIAKNTEASLAVEFNKLSLVAVNNIYTLRVNTESELKSIVIKFTVSNMATLIQGQDTIRTSNNVASKIFTFTDGEEKTFAVVSEDGLRKVDYKIRARVGTASQEADLKSIRIRVGSADFDGNIVGNIVNFTITDVLFGTNLNAELSYMTMSTYSSANKQIGSTFNFLASTNLEDSITIIAENPSVTKTYRLYLILIPSPIQYTSYTSTDTLGTVASNVQLVDNIADFLVVKNIADGVTYQWYVNGIKSTTSKASTGGALYLRRSDLGVDFTQKKSRDIVTLSIEGNKQKSSEHSFYFIPENVFTWQDFQSMGKNNTMRYRLMNSINFPADYLFVPMGAQGASAFAGQVDGRNFEVSNIKLDYPSSSNIGIFKELSSASIIRSLRIRGAIVRGLNNIGTITPKNFGTIQNCSVTSTTIESTGTDGTVGGLVGEHTGEILSGAFQGNIKASGDNVGGLAGKNLTNVIGFSYSDAGGDTIAGGYYIGGLVGRNDRGTVIGYSAITLKGDYLGGLVGNNVATSSAIGWSAPHFLNDGTDVALRGGLAGFNAGTIKGYWSQVHSSTPQGEFSSTADKTAAISISSIQNVNYQTSPSSGFYDNQGTTTTPDDKKTFDQADFLLYFTGVVNPSTSQFYAQTWPQLRTTIPINSVVYSFQISQPKLP